MPTLFELLRCPETGQTLAPAEPDLVDRLSTALKAGSLRNRGGALPEPFEGALVTLDGSRIYPIRDGIPVMLVDEAL